MYTAWKFLVMVGNRVVSEKDTSEWSHLTWRCERVPTEACRGLNCSALLADALGYVNGTVLARIEYDGGVIDTGDKLTCEKMRIVEAWKWDKIASVRLGIVAAEMVLGIYEEKYPDNKVPRLAIEAAKAWIKNPSCAASAASAASCAANYAASAASYAANAAARATVKASGAVSAARNAARHAASYVKTQLQARIEAEVIPTLERLW